MALERVVGVYVPTYLEMRAKAEAPSKGCMEMCAKYGSEGEPRIVPLGLWLHMLRNASKAEARSHGCLEVLAN